MKKLIILICAAFALGACNDFLDIKPKGYTIPETYEDYASLLNDVQMSKAAERYTAYLTDDVLLPGGTTLPQNISGKEEFERNLYTFAGGAVFPQGAKDGFWENSYWRIYTFNTVINNIMSVADASDDAKLALQAEARVGRAFEYLCLVAAYAPAYDPATAATDYGVPLITTEDMDVIFDYRRNTVAEVYGFIERDLEQALPHLPEVAPNAYRPGQSVGYGFYARMYLMMRDYARALEFAAQAVALDDALLDLKLYAVSPDPDANIGRIVLAADPSIPYPDEGDNPEYLYTRYYASSFGVSGKVYASDALLGTYARDLPGGATDKRRSLWFVDDSFPGIGNFPGYTIYAPFYMTNVGLGTVENMLTAAECYARRNAEGDLGKAEAIYNRLRDNRIVGNQAVQFTDAATGLQKILDERRREFPASYSRYVDLKRLNKETPRTVIHPGDPGIEYTLPAGDNRWIIPLPPKVISFRPDLPDYNR